MQIFFSWCPGIEKDLEALHLLNINNIGIEGTKVLEHPHQLQKLAIPYVFHSPILNLADIDYRSLLTQEKREQIDAMQFPFLSLHLGYSAGKVHKMRKHPNVPAKGTIISDRQVLMDTMVANIRWMRSQFPDKQIILESLNLTKNRPVHWEGQPSIAHKEEIEDTIRQFGSSAALAFVTDLSFIKELLDRTGSGFLFDVAHALITQDTTGDPGYIASLIALTKGRVREIHINTPGCDTFGFFDSHNPLTESQLSIEMLSIARKVLENNDVSALTFEIDTGLPPMAHVRSLLEQMESLKSQHIGFV